MTKKVFVFLECELRKQGDVRQSAWTLKWHEVERTISKKSRSAARPDHRIWYRDCNAALNMDFSGHYFMRKGQEVRPTSPLPRRLNGVHQLGWHRSPESDDSKGRESDSTCGPVYWQKYIH